MLPEFQPDIDRLRDLTAKGLNTSHIQDDTFRQYVFKCLVADGIKDISITFKKYIFRNSSEWLLFLYNNQDVSIDQISQYFDNMGITKYYRNFEGGKLLSNLSFIQSLFSKNEEKISTLENELMKAVCENISSQSYMSLRKVSKSLKGIKKMNRMVFIHQLSKVRDTKSFLQRFRLNLF